MPNDSTGGGIFELFREFSARKARAEEMKEQAKKLVKWVDDHEDWGAPELCEMRNTVNTVFDSILLSTLADLSKKANGNADGLYEAMVAKYAEPEEEK